MTFKFKVTNGNKKLGSNICAINMPAGTTCRKNAPCQHGCYAKKGNFAWDVVKTCYENNYKCFMEDPKQAEEDILNQLPLM